MGGKRRDYATASLQQGSSRKWNNAGYFSAQKDALPAEAGLIRQRGLPNLEHYSVGAHEHREAAMASCLIHRYRGLAVLVRSYRFNVCRATYQRPRRGGPSHHNDDLRTRRAPNARPYFTSRQVNGYR